MITTIFFCFHIPTRMCAICGRVCASHISLPLVSSVSTRVYVCCVYGSSNSHLQKNQPVLFSSCEIKSTRQHHNSSIKCYYHRSPLPAQVSPIHSCSLVRFLVHIITLSMIALCGPQFICSASSGFLAIASFPFQTHFLSLPSKKSNHPPFLVCLCV